MEINMESKDQSILDAGSEKTEMNKKERKLGGIKTMPFIFANELCDRFATAGANVNLISYLTQELNLPLVKASNTLKYFDGLYSFAPLIGALIADSFAGRFWTILVGSIIYDLGLVSITISAALPGLRPRCATKENCKEASSLQLLPLYISMILEAIGVGAIRPCVVTFAADQIDMHKTTVETRSWNFFNWYYFCIGVSIIIALTGVVYIQDNKSWSWGFGIPTVSMLLAIIAFAAGSPLYKRVKPGGSPVTRLAQVIVAAVKKQKLVLPADSSLLYENRELDAAISTNGRLLHTDQFKWLDRAAVITEDDKIVSNTPNLWRLATVHRIEELKSIIRALPIWAVGILLMATDSGSFVIQQARTMDRHLFHSFEIPPASLNTIGIAVMVIGIPIYERLFVPFARRFTGNPMGITYIQRMGIGLVVNFLSTIVLALVEIKRKAVAADHNLLDNPTATVPISIFWMFPHYLLSGVTAVFISVGHLEFLYDQTPESMRSTAPALYWLAVSMGNYIGALMTALIHKYTGKERNWLPDRNLNRGRLENFYLLMAGLQVLNFVYYLICAWLYTSKPLDEVSESKKKGDLELAAEKDQPKPLAEANGNWETEHKTD